MLQKIGGRAVQDTIAKENNMTKTIIAIALAWAFMTGLNSIELERAETVQNHAAASQLAELDR